MRDLISRFWLFDRPMVEPLGEAADCGYLCISALFAASGHSLLVDEIKEFAGRTSRGLTLRQVRDILTKYGVQADAVFFDTTKPEAFPCPGIVLLKHGHYIFLERRSKGGFKAFDPAFGWVRLKHTKLSRSCGGLGVVVGAVPEQSKASEFGWRERKNIVFQAAFRTLLWKRVRRAAFVFALAQLLILALPLLSMFSVDRAVSGLSVTLIGLVATGFVAITAINTVVSLIGDLMQAKLSRLAQSKMASAVFQALSQKEAQWFENNEPANLQHRIGSLDSVLQFRIRFVRAFSTASISLAAGLAVIFFISPALLLPGLISLAMAITLDLVFERRQHEAIATSIDSSQQGQSFVLDTLSQMPLLARHNALAGARTRHQRLVRRKAFTDSHLQSLQGWRAAVGGLSKAAENLVFATLAVSFMSKGQFAIGSFVALGAYKDLLADAIRSLFSLAMERRSLSVHALQASAIFDHRAERQPGRLMVRSGKVEFDKVSFSYGSLDQPVFTNLSHVFEGRKLTVIKGPSGVGKSTLVRLITGQFHPQSGAIRIDDQPVVSELSGFASVLQSDRLLNGTIKENISLFQSGVADEEIYQALEISQLKEFVLGLPMRLNTRVGEGIGGLSGGQRQRLLIARAVLRRPKLLVLDEASASLDVDTERAIFRELSLRDWTVIAVAHRPEVWELADHVVQLHGSELHYVTKPEDEACRAKVY